MNKPPRFGRTGLDRVALERMRGVKDDNHARPADEAKALENFESFASDFFDHQREFLRWAAEAPRQDD